MLDVAYGITRTLSGVPFEAARPRIEAALKAEGFGVLTEIDVQATLKQKLNQDFRRYLILGVCNPVLAHRALAVEPAVGLLLPCTIVVTEDDRANSVISALDPKSMLKVVGDAPPAEVESAMREARERITRAVAGA